MSVVPVRRFGGGAAGLIAGATLPLGQCAHAAWFGGGASSPSCSYCRSFRMLWGIWLAWASMAVPAWFMIWLRVKVTISRLMSVSLTRDSEDVRFSAATDRLATMCSKRFCVAPRVERAVETLAMAESSMAIAETAPALVVTSMLASCTENRPEVDVVSIFRFWVTESWFAAAEPAPTWKARPALAAL